MTILSNNTDKYVVSASVHFLQKKYTGVKIREL